MDEIMRDARGWLLDCGADPDDVEAASSGEIRSEVARLYAGGWPAFLADGMYVYGSDSREGLDDG